MMKDQFANYVVQKGCSVGVYINRVACYTKLGALPEGLKDANKCIELDPSFTKGYSRKAAVLFFMKEYDKAMELIRKVSNMMKTTRNY